MSTTAYGLAYTQACSYVMGFLENIIDCESIGDIMGRLVKAAVIVVLAVVAVSVMALGVNADNAVNTYVKVRVIRTYNFTSLSAYMYNASSKTLLPVNSTYVQVLSYELKDLSGSDSLMPAVVLSLDAPTVDLNTNESITYAYVLRGSYGGSLLAAVADINSTTNTVTNIQYFKISPVSGDIAIVRTNYDILIEGNGYKLSIPLSNFTNPKVLLMTDSDCTVSGISYIELRALTNPPLGFTLIRQGTGEASFTISANGELQVWFDESHSGGDLDCFVFDSSNPYFNDASISDSWAWLTGHATTQIFSDFAPQAASLTAHGQVKFIIKRFAGSANEVHWRVAVHLGRFQPINPPHEHTTQSQTTVTAVTTNHVQSGSNNRLTHLSGIWHSIQSALGGNALAVIIIMLFIIAIIAIVARR